MQPEGVESSLTAIGGLCCLIVFGPLLLVWLLRFHRVSKTRDGAMLAILRGWAEEHGYELIQHERRWLTPWFSNGGRQVFYVRLWDDRGRIRRGWVRCGGSFRGSQVQRAEVLWEEAAVPPARPAAERPSRDDPLWDPWMDG